MGKRTLYFVGLVTLLGFPLLGSALNYFWLKIPWTFFFGFDFSMSTLVLGACLGLVYAYFLLFVTEVSLNRELPDKIEKMISSMNLTLGEALFLSLCAGIGEELLFRAAIQPFVGPFVGAVLFVAVHGYLVPWSWKRSKYGLLILPLSFFLSYGYIVFGLWFSIGVHVMYDFVLFESLRTKSSR